MKKLMFIIVVIIFTSCGELWEKIQIDQSITKMLEAGEWEGALNNLKRIPKNDKMYLYAQEKIKRLIKGNNIFKNNPGVWKCKFADGDITETHFGLNTSAFRSKFNGNTWYIRPINSNSWEVDRRFVDYLDNGNLKIVGFLTGEKFDEFEMYK